MVNIAYHLHYPQSLEHVLSNLQRHRQCSPNMYKVDAISTFPRDAWKAVGDMPGNEAMAEYAEILSKAVPDWEVPPNCLCLMRLPNRRDVHQEALCPS